MELVAKMGLKRYSLVLASLLILALVFVVPASASNTWTINPGTGVINATINNGIVQSGDTIVLTPGTYFEKNINVSKNIIIESQSGSPQGTIIEGNRSTQGIFNVTGVYSLTINDVTIQDGFTTGNGAAINAETGSVTVASSVITNCTANDGSVGQVYGGAIYTTGGTLSVTSTAFSGCKATQGGTIFASGTISVSSSTFTNCYATIDGGGNAGGINVQSGTATISNSIFTGCTGNYYGGAVYGNPETTINIASSQFSGNSAGQEGGALWTQGHMTVTSSTITNCQAPSGGAIKVYSANGNLALTNTTISGCTSTGSIGGAIYGDASTTISLNDSTITGCRAASSGGAIYALGSLTVSGSTITNCSAVTDGGAIYSPASFTVSGSTITNCTASDASGYGGGGAIDGPQGGGMVTVTGSTITNCYATASNGLGGAISAQAINVSSSTISNSAAGGCGGALSSWSSVLLTDSSIISCNTTNNHGGAISAQTVTVQSSQISNCTSNNYGGAIYAGNIILDSTTITNCSTGSEGGAICASVNVNITGSTITNCSATGTSGNGGGVYSGGSVTATSSTFSGCNCPAYTTGGEEGYTNNAGGAIYATDGLNVSGSTFTNCGIASPNGWGGAIFVQSTEEETAPSPGVTSPVAYATVTNATFTNCYGGWDGGAVFVQNGNLAVSSSTFTNCTDLNNYAYGGAINARHEEGPGGYLTVTSSTFTNCAAGNGMGLGGAIYADNEAVVNQTTITNCSVIGADSDGGAIFSKGLAVLNQTTIIDCSAGGAQSHGGAVFASGGTIQFSRLINDNTTTAVVQGEFFGSPGASQNSHNAGTASSGVSGTYAAMIATDNWWGTNSNVSSFVSTGVVYNPWLVLNVTATPAAITYYPLQTSTVQASLIYDSNGDNTYVPGSVVPDGIPVSFSVISGPGGVNPSQSVTTSGLSQTTFTPTGDGTATVDATVDGYPVSVAIGITGAAPTSHSHSAGTVYWENTGNTGTSTGYTGPSTTPAAGSPTQMPTAAHPTVMPTQPPTVNQPALASTTIPPLPTNTPKSGIDAVPVIGAIGLCGVIVLFRKNGN
jgi:hypothetical protein